MAGAHNPCSKFGWAVLVAVLVRCYDNKDFCQCHIGRSGDGYVSLWQKLCAGIQGNRFVAPTLGGRLGDARDCSDATAFRYGFGYWVMNRFI